MTSRRTLAGTGSRRYKSRTGPTFGRRRKVVRMTRYTDYCPIGSGVEVLGDRWTPLVIREMSVGASGFNEIHRGIPRISRTLLAQRLRMLEARGVVRRDA